MPTKEGMAPLPTQGHSITDQGLRKCQVTETKKNPHCQQHHAHIVRHPRLRPWWSACVHVASVEKGVLVCLCVSLRE